MPSLEPVAAQMTERGRGDKIFAVLSLLFKTELTCVLAIIIATVGAGAEIIAMLSRPAYAPYYYILPILMVGLILSTIYRMLEILGSMNMTYKIFLRMWPLSVAAVAALYFTVGNWGVVSVLAVPIAEIGMRVALLAFAFRRQGVWKALDPARSLRLIASAVIVLSCSSLALGRYGASFEGAGLLTAAGGIVAFLSAILIIRPLSALECDTVSQILPASWTFPRYLARVLARP